MWPVTGTETKYENNWMSVREDAVVRPDGGPGSFGVMTVRHASVFVVALTEDDQVWLVDVDRHTVGRSLEIPSGGSDGQDPLVAAQRELAEETGLVAEHWRKIGEMDALNGICEAPEHVYLATGLSPAAIDRMEQDVEGIMSARPLPWSEVLAMVADARIRDGETIAALMFATIVRG